jgi:DNA-binding NarL/FixJ family response regulator
MPTSPITPSRTGSSSRPADFPPAPGNPDSVRSGGTAPSGPLRVFLVEDSVAGRDRLSDFLAVADRIEIVGHAETEADAVRQLAAQPVDVAIVDLSLRQGSGLGVIEAVRVRRPKPPPTIVVLTNFASTEFEAACRARGADHFFDKVTQFGAIRTLLQSMLHGGRRN